jgi:hypothetical protein
MRGFDLQVFRSPRLCYAAAAAAPVARRVTRSFPPAKDTKGRPMTAHSHRAVAVLWMLLVVGCGSYPPPTDRIASSEAALRGATEVGAAQIPRAALHLKLAEEQIDKAKRFIQDGYNQRAELALQRAQADAEFALSIAREHQTLEKLQVARQNLEKLKAQYGR